MDPISISASLTPTLAEPTTKSIADMNSSDFFQLLIAELTNQDPFEPTDNKDLLKQISSIREIELSAGLTDSLASLSGQQQYSSASSMIGKFVSGSINEAGAIDRGLVVGVRFDAAGNPILQLASGAELPIEQVAAIESPERAAEALIGQAVIGVDRREPSDPQVVEGEVVSVTLGDRGEIVLELDNGESLRLLDMTDVKSLAV